MGSKRAGALFSFHDLTLDLPASLDWRVAGLGLAAKMKIQNRALRNLEPALVLT